VVRARGALVPSASIGPVAAVQTLSGTVTALFVFETFDRRTGVALYGLRIVNQSASTLICRIWAVTRSASPVLAYPLHFEIKPFSTTAAQVPVRPGEFESFERAMAEVTGDDVRCLVQTVSLPQSPRRGVGSAAVACGAFALLAVAGVVAGAIALSTVQPRIAAFAVPPMALSGTTVQAEYSASGAGTLAYQITAPDGHRLQGGALAAHSGAIPVSLPASTDSGAYTLQMTMRGPFGNAKEVRVLNALPLKRGGAAQVASVQVAPIAAKPGQTVAVSYAANADDGYVRMTGSDGAIWAQKPFSRSGSTAFTVPPVSGTHEMRVVVHVTKGGSTAESSAGFIVSAAPAAPVVAAAAPAAQVAGYDGATQTSSAEAGANGTFQVTTPVVRSGGSIHVQILSPRNDMRISLNDATHEVSGRVVGSDATTVTLVAPAVKVPTRFTVMASFSDGFGQESIVAPVTVRP
jgi:hypothetical protein